MPRILQTKVAPLYPAEGPVEVMLFGEAPGPRGADQSGLPFWGDRAGVLVYQALVRKDLASVPPEAFESWDGARFRTLGLAPVLRRAALSNAWPSCPTRDGQTFRAPTDRELRDPANLDRLRAEVALARARCPGRLRILTLGMRARWILAQLDPEESFDLHGLPHPSAQGLLQAAPGKGRGLRLADLQEAWKARLLELLP